uniref:Uncharacterized protein n=1 Tax=Plectus sambesii TaxID=2011161 RepID=A0A914XGJ3_9BILA
MRVHTHLCFGRRKRTRSQLRGLCGFQASERSQEFAECLSALKTRGGLCYIASLVAFCCAEGGASSMAIRLRTCFNTNHDTTNAKRENVRLRLLENGSLIADHITI